MYSIKFDPPSRTLHLSLDGFWTSVTLASFAAELLVETTALHLRYGSYAILSDSSRFPVQSPEVAAGFDGIMKRGAEVHNGPTAIVVASILNKMQAERSVRGPNVRVFLSADEARGWIEEWHPERAT